MLCPAVGLKGFFCKGGKGLVGTSTPGITVSEHCTFLIYPALNFLCLRKGKNVFLISNNWKPLSSKLSPLFNQDKQNYIKFLSSLLCKGPLKCKWVHS